MPLVDDVCLDDVVELAEFERLASELMPPAVRVIAENGGEVGNEAAWEGWSLRPRALREVSEIDTSTTVLGQRIGLPAMVAPFALQTLCHPDAEVATARGARQANTLMTLSLATTRSPEEVGAVSPNGFWMNLQFLKDRGLMAEVAQRAAAAGATAICFTVDLPVVPWWPAEVRLTLTSVQRDLNSCFFPDQSVQSERMGWDYRVLDSSATWADLAWLREISPLPIVLKGIHNAEDAVLAVEHGAAAIVVSNHGGHTLPQAAPTADVLPEIADAVGDRLELLVDGGIRSGADVVRALAMGARAVLIGRPALWGLVVGGAEGLERVLEILREELKVLMALTGTRSVAELDNTTISRRV